MDDDPYSLREVALAIVGLKKEISKTLSGIRRKINRFAFLFVVLLVLGIGGLFVTLLTTTIFNVASGPDPQLFEALNEKLSGLDARTDTIEARLTGLEESISAMQETGEAARRDLAQLKEMVREMTVARQPAPDPVPTSADGRSPDGAPISTSDAPPPLIGPLRPPPPRPSP